MSRYVRMKNTRTGEVRDIEVPSPEATALAAEVLDDGKGEAMPAWEEVGHAPRVPTDESIKANSLAQVGPEQHPERQLTQAEIDAGITSYEQKLFELGLGPDPNASASEGESEGEGEDEGYENLKKDELKAELDERGIAYKASATNAELIALLEEDDAAEDSDDESEEESEGEDEEDLDTSLSDSDDGDESEDDSDDTDDEGDEEDAG